MASHQAVQNGMEIDGSQPLNVYFLDNGCKMMLVDQDSTAEQVCEELAHKIGFNVDECEMIGRYFCLYESIDGQLANRPIMAQENVLQVQQGCAKIIYMCKLFMERAMELEDPVAVKLMFVQAHHNIVTGHYYCPIETIMQLAGILMFEKFGAYDSSKHREGFIPPGRLYEFIPATLMGTKKPAYWEREIYSAHQEIGTVLQNPKQAYLRLCKDLDCYGCAFFEAKQYCLANYPPKLLIGINARGIWLMMLETRKQLECFRLSEIYRWGFKPGMNFYFEAKGTVPGEKGPVYEFTTERGNRISELLTDYAHALLEELGISRKSAKPPPPPGSPSKSNEPPPPPGPPPASIPDHLQNFDDDEDDYDMPEMDEDDAATKLQSAFRGAKLRGDLEKEYACIQVQALWRGYLERIRFDKMIEALESQLEDEELEDEEAEE